MPSFSALSITIPKLIGGNDLENNWQRPRERHPHCVFLNLATASKKRSPRQPDDSMPGPFGHFGGAGGRFPAFFVARRKRNLPSRNAGVA
jgi:hypothetical protein